MVIKKIGWVDYFIVFLLVFVSGSPIMKNQDMIVAISRITLFIISLIYWLYWTNQKILGSFIKYVMIFLLLFLLQTIFFSYLAIFDIIHFIILLLIAYFILYTLQSKFYKIYVNIICFIILISLPLYVASVLIPGFISMLVTVGIHHPNPEISMTPNLILFHTRGLMLNYDSIRNSALFWEPGALAGFANIALLFNIVTKSRITSYKNLVIIIGILTTQSTSGYIALMAIVMLYYLIYSSSQYKVFIVVFILLISSITFFSLPFLSDKIENKYESTQVRDLRSVSKTRFGSALVDLQDFLKSPIFGRGSDPITRYEFDEYFWGLNRNNGVTDFLVRFGFIGFVVYFYALRKGFKILSDISGLQNLKWLPSYCLAIIIILGFSELYFYLPFFIALSVISVSFINEKNYY